ncbi:MAG TPA: hypothetical protein VFH95_09915 [Candidatus Kapabacteria bacterium]|nr:hypothetical protein [Candidatus Kapabacteria bacterium]
MIRTLPPTLPVAAPGERLASTKGMHHPAWMALCGESSNEPEEQKSLMNKNA